MPEVSERFVRWATNPDFKEPRLIEVDRVSDKPPIDARNIKYFLNIPLISEGELVGVITLGKVEGPSFTQRNIKTLSIMASQIAGILRRAREYQKVEERKNLELKALYHQIEVMGEKYKFDNIIGKNHKMRKIYSIVSNIADASVNVLIRGETGTAKDLIAGIIHFHSPRREKPFIPVNCAALPESLLESELFGHVKGAFTGAYRDRPGRFELANRGTLFLDEIGDISLSTQAKLLRVLQEMEFERVGGSQTIKVDVRIIAATNQNLEENIKKGTFRRDLYYRLNVVPIDIPPLRERLDDLPLLVQHFLKICSHKYQKGTKNIS